MKGGISTYLLLVLHMYTMVRCTTTPFGTMTEATTAQQTVDGNKIARIIRTTFTKEKYKVVQDITTVQVFYHL